MVSEKYVNVRIRASVYTELRELAVRLVGSPSVSSMIVALVRSAKAGGMKVELKPEAPPKPAVMPVRAKNAPFTPDELEVLNSYEVYMHHVVSMVPGSTMKEEYDALPTSQQLEEAQRWWDMDMDSPKNNEYSIYRTWETFDARDATVTPLELPEGYEDLDIEE